MTFVWGRRPDRPISVRDEMFAPFYLLRYANDAVIQESDGSTRPLVLSQSEVVEGRDVEIQKNSLGLRHCQHGYFSFAWRG